MESYPNKKNISPEMLQQDFLDAFRAILTNANALEDASKKRGSIRDSNHKYLSMRDYNKAGTRVEKTRIELINVDLPNQTALSLTEFDKIGFNAALWEAESQVYVKYAHQILDPIDFEHLTPEEAGEAIGAAQNNFRATIREAANIILSQLSHFKMISTNMPDEETLRVLSQIQPVISSTRKSKVEVDSNENVAKPIDAKESLGRLEAFATEIAEYCSINQLQNSPEYKSLYNVCMTILTIIEAEKTADNKVPTILEKLYDIKSLLEDDYKEALNPPKKGISSLFSTTLSPAKAVEQLNNNQKEDHPLRLAGLLLREAIAGTDSSDPLRVSQIIIPKTKLYDLFRSNSKEEQTLRTNTNPGKTK